MNRIGTMLSLIGECEVLADIGTDHAYLPIEAVRGGLCKRAIACDIVDGPLFMAKKNIHAAGLQDRIETRLGDGLRPLGENEADCIVIAGMGGMNIIEILRVGITPPRLILQPQHDLEELRRFLHAKGYKIKETLARERSRFYVVMHVENGEQDHYTEAEYFTGRFDSEYRNAYFCELLKKISRFINAITDEKTREVAEKRKSWLESAISEG
ncbi:MAG: class I SAM-dependent methyltransferase [Defluviitaleaceae bacterium]|nr:class I SAM-dependent methyltransferase [Defluviitaleaceae bacterium]